MKAVHLNFSKWLHPILALVLLILLETCNSSKAIVSKYEILDGSYFNHMVYDYKRSTLYCGAMNRIIHLNAHNLSLKNFAVTGPKPDSPLCHAGGCGKDIETKDTDNYNKVLILNNRQSADKEKDTLIACGSLHQGSCDIFEDLDKFPSSSRSIELPLVANDENSSSFAFIGPSKYTVWVSWFDFYCYIVVGFCLITNILSGPRGHPVYWNLVHRCR